MTIIPLATDIPADIASALATLQSQLDTLTGLITTLQVQQNTIMGVLDNMQLDTPPP